MTSDQTTTEAVLDQARELGRLIADHPASRSYREALQALQEDSEAQRLLNDYQREARRIAEKESSQQPVEVEEKRKFQDLQTRVAMSDGLKRMQQTQMDYLDLMRKVESAMAESARGGNA